MLTCLPRSWSFLFLASSPGRALPANSFGRDLGYDYVGDTRTVDAYCASEKTGSSPNWKISTIWGIGYKFEQLH